MAASRLGATFGCEASMEQAARPDNTPRSICSPAFAPSISPSPRPARPVPKRSPGSAPSGEDREPEDGRSRQPTAAWAAGQRSLLLPRVQHKMRASIGYTISTIRDSWSSIAGQSFRALACAARAGFCGTSRGASHMKPTLAWRSAHPTTTQPRGTCRNRRLNRLMHADSDRLNDLPGV